MNPDTEEKEIDAQLQARFKQLPSVVQKAISSANVENHLRELSETHKLHLDQWQLLENEVMLALLGFQPLEKLKENIQNEVGVSSEIATALATDVSKTVFEPIRAELEKELEPAAQAASTIPQQEPRSASGAQPSATSSAAEATPPQAQAAAPQAGGQEPAETPTAGDAAQEEQKKVVRATALETYKLGEPSTARKSIEDDPYREPLA